MSGNGPRRGAFLKAREKGRRVSRRRYAACDRADTQKLFAAYPDGACYITSSRDVAKAVRASHGNVMSSTGGPNTLVAPSLTEEIQSAIRDSALIEHSGQCTALRHACVGGVTAADVDKIFAAAPSVSTPADALATVRGCSAIVGMHPDGAAEAIVDFALATGTIFALVPCCVVGAAGLDLLSPAG